MNLSRHQKVLYGLLLGRGDVSIDLLHHALSGVRRSPLSTSAKQRWLGPYIQRLNRRLSHEGMKVEPGALKGTYRLVATIAAA